MSSHVVGSLHSPLTPGPSTLLLLTDRRSAFLHCSAHHDTSGAFVGATCNAEVGLCAQIDPSTFKTPTLPSCSHHFEDSTPVYKVSAEGAVVEEDIGVAELGVESGLHARHAAQDAVAVAVPGQHHDCCARPPLRPLHLRRRAVRIREYRLTVRIAAETCPASRKRFELNYSSLAPSSWELLCDLRAAWCICRSTDPPAKSRGRKLSDSHCSNIGKATCMHERS